MIFEYDNIRFGLLQGATDHHENNKIAYKWADETATTKFREIELNTTRTGMVSLTALFDKVIIDSTEVSRASVHNYDIFQEFQLVKAMILLFIRQIKSFLKLKRI